VKYFDSVVQRTLAPNRPKRLPRGQSPGDVLRADRRAFDGKAERAQLVFLPFAVALPQLSALAVKDHPREAMAPLPAIQLGQNAPSVCWVADIVEQDDGSGVHAND